MGILGVEDCDAGEDYLVGVNTKGGVTMGLGVNEHGLKEFVIKRE